MDIYILLYFKWITNKVLIAQRTLLSVMWQPGWEGIREERIHVCVAESLCCPPETITVLLASFTPRRRGCQKMRRLDGIADAVDTNLGKLQEMVRAPESILRHP